MALFGPNPQDLASSAVSAGKEAQKKTRKYLSKKNKSLRRQLNRAQEDLALATGTGPTEAKETYNQNFLNTIAAIGQQYSKQLAQYDPNILASKSAKRFAGELNKSMQDYTNRLNLMGQRGAAQMYQAMAQPISQFRQISEDPAFNNLTNATFMEFATNPPTVRSDVESMKNLYTYNV
jgi:hydroxymethylpyrimidine pyrophosphatase-like HAD family hydrolase